MGTNSLDRILPRWRECSGEKRPFQYTSQYVRISDFLRKFDDGLLPILRTRGRPFFGGPAVRRLPAGLAEDILLPEAKDKMTFLPASYIKAGLAIDLLQHWMGQQLLLQLATATLS